MSGRVLTEQAANELDSEPGYQREKLHEIRLQVNRVLDFTRRSVFDLEFVATRAAST